MSEVNTSLLLQVIREGFRKRNVALFDELFADGAYLVPRGGML